MNIRRSRRGQQRNYFILKKNHHRWDLKMLVRTENDVYHRIVRHYRNKFDFYIIRNIFVRILNWASIHDVMKIILQMRTFIRHLSNLVDFVCFVFVWSDDKQRITLVYENFDPFTHAVPFVKLSNDTKFFFSMWFVRKKSMKIRESKQKKIVRHCH